MFSRVVAFILAIGVAAGIGAFVALRVAPDNSSAADVSVRVAENLAQRLTNDESADRDPEQVTQIVGSLMQILDEEISERQILAEQLEEVQSELAELQGNLRTRVQAAFSENAVISDSEPASEQVTRSREERVASAGFTMQQFDSLRRKEDGAQMRQIELDDRARREGWLNSPRYFDEINQLVSGTESIRQELGDDAYERYLYAGGRSNRVAVGSVIPMSPAERAGFQSGDVIKSYGGQRVFTGQQLVNLRSGGDSGSSVMVEVIRDGQIVHITMPRGPMGIQTRVNSVDPSASDGG